MSARIVVIDDEREVAELLGKVLTRAGYSVELALSGEAGLAALAEAPAACVLLDKVLPGLGGLEVLAEVRRRWPDTAVVLMTGHPEPFTLEAERPECVLSKPFRSLDSVVAAVGDAVEAAQASRADPLSNLRDRVAAVVAEIAPGLKRRD